ncbi:MAG: hypothetical protein ACLPX5_11460 [Dissulfurispiraceae bacterium]
MGRPYKKADIITAEIVQIAHRYRAYPTALQELSCKRLWRQEPLPHQTQAVSLAVEAGSPD